jgi:hypothetical protein
MVSPTRMSALLLFEPVERDSRERDFLVGTFLAALEEAADGFVGQHGETGISRGAGMKEFAHGPGGAFIIAEANRKIFASGAGRIGKKDSGTASILGPAISKNAGLADRLNQCFVEFHGGPGYAGIVAAGDSTTILFVVGTHVLEQRTVGALDDGRFVG